MEPTEKPAPTLDELIEQASRRLARELVSTDNADTCRNVACTLGILIDKRAVDIAARRDRLIRQLRAKVDDLEIKLDRARRLSEGP